MATPRFFSATNGYLPVPSSIIIGYTRDPKKFKLPEYVQYIQAPAPVAQYRKLDTDSPVRVVADATFAWEDGDDDEGGGHANLSQFEWAEFRTKRRRYPFRLGNQAVENSRKHGNFDLITFESKAKASQAMTNRTHRVITMLESSSNWGSNYATADVLNEGRGYWDQSSSNETDSTFNAIFFSMMQAIDYINLRTNAMVQLSDLVMVLSPGAAKKIAGSGEIRSYMKGSPFSAPVIKGEGDWNPNEQWGLPPYLYGVKIVIEDAVRVSSVPKASGAAATTTRTRIKSDDTAFLMARPGALDAPYGGDNFSTCQLFWYSALPSKDGGGELLVQVKTDDWSENVKGRVVEQFAEIVAAPASGYLITEILSS